jgi:Flp pilus assembly pilin Flp
MKLALARFWNEQDGAILSAEIMMVATILVLGMIVGLKSVRDSVVTELADVAQGMGNSSQSYSYSGTSGHAANGGGGQFADNTDFCDAPGFAGTNSKCVNVAHVDGAESFR